MDQHGLRPLSLQDVAGTEVTSPFKLSTLRSWSLRIYMASFISGFQNGHIPWNMYSGIILVVTVTG